MCFEMRTQIVKTQASPQTFLDVFTQPLKKNPKTNVDAVKNKSYSLILFLPLLSLFVTGGTWWLQPSQRDARLLRDQQQNCLHFLFGGGGAECLRLWQAAVGHPAAHPAGQGGPDSGGNVAAHSEHSPATQNRWLKLMENITIPWVRGWERTDLMFLLWRRRVKGWRITEVRGEEEGENTWREGRVWGNAARVQGGRHRGRVEQRQN